MSFSTASIFRSRPGIADPQEITIAPFANDAMAVTSLSLSGILAWHSTIAYCCLLEGLSAVTFPYLSNALDSPQHYRQPESA
jgi:hypothetical protein